MSNQGALPLRCLCGKVSYSSSEYGPTFPQSRFVTCSSVNTERSLRVRTITLCCSDLRSSQGAIGFAPAGIAVTAIWDLVSERVFLTYVGTPLRSSLVVAIPGSSVALLSSSDVPSSPESVRLALRQFSDGWLHAKVHGFLPLREMYLGSFGLKARCGRSGDTFPSVFAIWPESMRDPIEELRSVWSFTRSNASRAGVLSATRNVGRLLGR